MAFAHGEICKTIAMVAQLSAPYLTEGATKIDEGQLAGKRVGESYKFTFDKATVDVSKNGMKSWSGSTGATTGETEELKIWDASAYISNSALDKKLSAGDWEQFAKQTGIDVINKMVEEVALADCGKGEAVIVVDSVSDLVAKSVVMNKYGASVRAYGSWNAIGKILSTSKLNAPLLSEDKYANGQSWTFGNYASMRGITLPSMTRKVTSGSGATSVTTIAISTAGAVTLVGSASAGELVKLDGKDIWVYFPTTGSAGVVSDAIVIGDKSNYDTSAISATSPEACTTAETYEPMILRADGSQGFVDASNLVEASDGHEGYEGVGVAHTEIKNANRGLDHYYDVVGAYGLARVESARVILLKA